MKWQQISACFQISAITATWWEMHSGILGSILHCEESAGNGILHHSFGRQYAVHTHGVCSRQYVSMQLPTQHVSLSFNVSVPGRCWWTLPAPTTGAGFIPPAPSRGRSDWKTEPLCLLFRLSCYGNAHHRLQPPPPHLSYSPSTTCHFHSPRNLPRIPLTAGIQVARPCWRSWKYVDHSGTKVYV